MQTVAEGMHLGDVVQAAAGEQVAGVAHEVQEGAVGRLADHGAAGGAPALGAARDAAPPVVHHERVQRAVQLLRHRAVEGLRQAVHEILHMREASVSAHNSEQASSRMRYQTCAPVCGLNPNLLPPCSCINIMDPHSASLLEPLRVSNCSWQVQQEVACAELAKAAKEAATHLHGALHAASVDAALVAGDSACVGDLLALVEDHAGQRCAAAALHARPYCRLSCLHTRHQIIRDSQGIAVQEELVM